MQGVAVDLSEWIDRHFDELVLQYVNQDCFRASDIAHPDNPWHRPTVVDVEPALLRRAISADGLSTRRNLLLQRVLFNTYEQDLSYFDASSFNGNRRYFDSFYDSRNAALGVVLRPILEQAAFGFLQDTVPPRWQGSGAELLRHMTRVVDASDAAPVAIGEFIRQSDAPSLAARSLLIQLAPDALTEASAMGRTLLGLFGEDQSALMRVFIDEYGEGKHRAKHGTLYAKLMNTAELSARPHFYYSSYLPTSLLITNYFHFLCSHRHHWYRYLGALFYLEATMPHYARQMVGLLGEYLGPAVDTEYFGEHAHIDPEHKRIVLDDLIGSSMRRYGQGILGDLYHGFEVIQILLRASEADYRAQIEFAKGARACISSGKRSGVVVDRVVDRPIIGTMEDTDSLLTVTSGHAYLDVLGFQSLEIDCDRTVFLPKGRLYSIAEPSGGFRATVATA